MCALKTFNLDKEVYEEFSKHCKEHGISMSKKVEKFIRKEVHSIKMRKKDLDGSGLEIEKEVKPGPPSDPRQDDRKNAGNDGHTMGKYT